MQFSTNKTQYTWQTDIQELAGNTGFVQHRTDLVYPTLSQVSRTLFHFYSSRHQGYFCDNYRFSYYRFSAIVHFWKICHFVALTCVASTQLIQMPAKFPKATRIFNAKFPEEMQLFRLNFYFSSPALSRSCSRILGTFSSSSDDSRSRHSHQGSRWFPRGRPASSVRGLCFLCMEVCATFDSRCVLPLVRGGGTSFCSRFVGGLNSRFVTILCRRRFVPPRSHLFTGTLF